MIKLYFFKVLPDDTSLASLVIFTLIQEFLCITKVWPLHFQSQNERKMVMALENLAYFPPIIDKIGLCEKNVKSVMRHRLR